MTFTEVIFQSIKEMPLWLKVIIPLSIIFFVNNKKSLIQTDLNRRVELMKWNMKS